MQFSPNPPWTILLIPLSLFVGSSPQPFRMRGSTAFLAVLRWSSFSRTNLMRQKILTSRTPTPTPNPWPRFSNNISEISLSRCSPRSSSPSLLQLEVRGTPFFLPSANPEFLPFFLFSRNPECRGAGSSTHGLGAPASVAQLRAAQCADGPPAADREPQQ